MSQDLEKIKFMQEIEKRIDIAFNDYKIRGSEIKKSFYTSLKTLTEIEARKRNSKKHDDMIQALENEFFFRIQKENKLKIIDRSPCGLIASVPFKKIEKIIFIITFGEEGERWAKLKGYK